MIGIEERDSQTGIHVVRLHYTADPRKRSPEWLAAAKQGLDELSWQKEYEINWQIASGHPIFGSDFNRELHVAKSPLLVIPGAPIQPGFDFGLMPACIWCQLTPYGHLNVLRELPTWDGRGEQKTQGIERLAEQMKLVNDTVYAGCHLSAYADPAGWARSQADEKTCVEILLRPQYGIRDISPGPITWEARKKAMRYVLTTMLHDGLPILQVDPSCQMIIEGLGSAYKYKQTGEGRDAILREDPLKNAWSHPMEALQYVVGALFYYEAAKKAAPAPVNDNPRVLPTRAERMAARPETEEYL